jgi:hypothetical protein
VAAVTQTTSAPKTLEVFRAVQELGGYRVSTRDVADWLGYGETQSQLRSVRERLYALWLGGLLEKPMYRRMLWTVKGRPR